MGRFDLHALLATMLRFRAAPGQGHMDRLKRIYSYAIRTRDYAITSRADQPDYYRLPSPISKLSFLQTVQYILHTLLVWSYISHVQAPHLGSIVNIYNLCIPFLN